MLVKAPGQSADFNFTGHTLVIPCHAAGMSAFIGLDMYILNEGMVKAGYFKSQYIANGISNDGLSVAGTEG